MATKNKKKKKSGEQIIPTEQKQGISLENDDPGPPAPEKKSLQPADRRANGISIFTCSACMFLAFILGLYIGTLIPEIMQKTPQMAEVDTLQLPVPTEQAKTADSAAEDKGMHKALAERIDNMEKEAAINPGNPHTWAELGNLYFDANEPEKAIAAYEKSLALDHNNADVWTDLGIMYRELDNFARAVECFRTATSVDPKHEKAYYNEGIVLSTDLHNSQEAIAAWEKLLKLNPNAEAPDGTHLSFMIKQLQ